VEIGVQHIALEQVTTQILRRTAPLLVTVTFVIGARFTSDRDVPAFTLSERNVFELVGPISSARRVAHHAPVFILPENPVRRRRWYLRSGNCFCLLCSQRYRSQARQHAEGRYAKWRKKSPVCPSDVI